MLAGGSRDARAGPGPRRDVRAKATGSATQGLSADRSPRYLDGGCWRGADLDQLRSAIRTRPAGRFRTLQPALRDPSLQPIVDHGGHLPGPRVAKVDAVGEVGGIGPERREVVGGEVQDPVLG